MNEKRIKQVEGNTQMSQLLPDLNYYYCTTTKGHHIYLQFFQKQIKVVSTGLNSTKHDSGDNHHRLPCKPTRNFETGNGFCTHRSRCVHRRLRQTIQNLSGNPHLV
jgi:hypothetical protein